MTRLEPRGVRALPCARRTSYFGAHRPASTRVEARLVRDDLLVEIEAIAVLPG
jgi:enamine deaminase RidA (YjgF/YER057c/UK114 family)